MKYLVKKAGSLALIGREVPKYFIPEEVDGILQNTKSKRDTLILSIMWQTGLRVGELLSLKREDVDFYSQTIKVKTEKRKGHIRIIPISPSLSGELAKWIADKQILDRQSLFKLTRFRVHQIVKDACLKAGIDRKRSHSHTFRDSFAVQCVLSGVPTLVLNEWLGHANVENTLVYTKVLATDSKQFYDKIVW